MLKKGQIVQFINDRIFTKPENRYKKIVAIPSGTIFIIERDLFDGTYLGIEVKSNKIQKTIIKPEEVIILTFN
jgi:hypothetical protein